MGFALCYYGLGLDPHGALNSALSIVGIVTNFVSTLATPNKLYKVLRSGFAPLSKVIFAPRYTATMLGPVKYCDLCTAKFDLDNNLYGNTNGDMDQHNCTPGNHAGRILPYHNLGTEYLCISMCEHFKI